MNVIPYVFAVSTTLFLVVNRRTVLKDVTVTTESTIARPKRSELPITVDDWRNLLDLSDKSHNPIKEKWYLLKDLFEKQFNILLWYNYTTTIQVPCLEDTKLPRVNGYNTLSHCNTNKCISRWSQWSPRNGAQHVARTASGCDVMIRVVCSGGQGENYRDILRFLNQAPDILLSTNHVLPMLVEMEFEDIIFGAFPKVDAALWYALSSSYSNSVEDILYMMLEALEGVKYLHTHRIAHQDLFLLNFVIQWQPESMIKRATVRPRVWIIDLEDSVMFAENTRPEDMKVDKFPRVLEECARSLAPEVFKTEPYCPFKLDVWQFAQDLKEFDFGFEEVTQILEDMSKDVPEERITAAQAFDRLDSFVRSQPPSALHTPFPGR